MAGAESIGSIEISLLIRRVVTIYGSGGKDRLGIALP